jgi:succinyl-diaminopimelate desuccinylase
MNMFISDVIESTCHLVRYPSITPDDCDCLEDLAKELSSMGFDVDLKVFEDTTNLFARWGQGGPHLCFAGHVDVVPPGPRDAWESDPFDPVIRDGFLYGRGTADMKGAIACFLSALFEYVSGTRSHEGSISLLLTSDEEGLGTNGVPKMIPWMREQGHVPDLILIGEPTGSKAGSVLQIGRRGSLLGRVDIHGKQGHIAYPDLSDNPVGRLHVCLGALLSMNTDFMDKGDDYFEPSYLAVTHVGTPDLAENVTPGQAWVRFGVRFNPLQSAQNLQEEIQKRCQASAGPLVDVSFRLSGHPFLTKDPHWINLCTQAIAKATGKAPTLSTRGGTTDGRFLHTLAPVVELGLSEDTIHQVNECVVVDDLKCLKSCYALILEDFFPKNPSA